MPGARLLTSAFGCYQLALPEDAVEVVVAERAAGRAELEAALVGADQALAIASQVLLPGEDAEWLGRLRGRLHDTRLRALAVRAEAFLRLGRLDASAEDARASIGLDPFRESSYRLLMQAYASAGRTPEAHGTAA